MPEASEVKARFPQYMRAAVACQYLRDVHNIEIKPPTLALRRRDGSGPKYYRSGRSPEYTPETLDEFAARYRGQPVRGVFEERQRS